MDKEIQHILALSLIKGVGASFIKNRLNEIETYINDIDLLGNMLGGKITVERIKENLPLANKIIEESEEHNISIIPIINKKYPTLLKEIKNPPPVLYLKGNIKNLYKCMAIIGTRKSNELGNNIASKVGEFFSENWSICNGLVDGIDKNSIINNEAIFSNVTGVLSGGLNYNKTSSKITKHLAEQVLSNNGLLISEYPPNKREDQFSGSKASRIQAGLSIGIILVQSNVSGGSKYTIKAFSEVERPLGVINFSENQNFNEDENFSGNRLLLKKGVPAIAEMCDIKKINNIRTNKIISIAGKDDYLLFEEELKKIYLKSSN